jgi:pilus assembly protein CpaF
VHQSRLKDGTRRLTHVTEIVGMEGDVVTLQDIYAFDYRAGIDENGRFRGIIQPTGLRPSFLERLSDHGVHFPNELFQNESGSVPLAMRR